MSKSKDKPRAPSKLMEQAAIDLIHRWADRYGWDHWLLARATNRA